MSCLKMNVIKLRIMDRLVQAGYSPEQQDSHVKWSKGHANCAWFAKDVIQANINSEASAIIHRVAGAPNGNDSVSQKGEYDSWYTDGYRCRTKPTGKSASILRPLARYVSGKFRFLKPKT